MAEKKCGRRRPAAGWQRREAKASPGHFKMDGLTGNSRDRPHTFSAVESFKTITFNLAAVLHAIEENCAHPRFLIHDGPREADGAWVIYERFSLYARRIENSQPPDEATFQYILTTTTHPPSDMQ